MGVCRAKAIKTGCGLAGSATNCRLSVTRFFTLKYLIPGGCMCLIRTEKQKYTRIASWTFDIESPNTGTTLQTLFDLIMTQVNTLPRLPSCPAVAGRILSAGCSYTKRIGAVQLYLPLRSRLLLQPTFNSLVLLVPKINPIISWHLSIALSCHPVRTFPTILRYSRISPMAILALSAIAELKYAVPSGDLEIPTSVELV
jgi:hypothetical protein